MEILRSTLRQTTMKNIKSRDFVSSVVIQTSRGRSKPLIQNQHRQARISIKETKNSDQCNFVTGVAIQKSNGLSRTPLKNHTPCATNREKTSAFTPYQTKKKTMPPSLTRTRQKKKKKPFTSLIADNPQGEKENYL
jgi:hypothetical protein